VGIVSTIRYLYVARPDCLGTLYLDEPGQFFLIQSGRCSHLNGTPCELHWRQMETTTITDR
jgi:hypothetical protein